jgi:F0F1-type ATP synthase delta subunit
MKYKPQDYAKAFAEVAARTPSGREEAILKNFLAIVRRNGDMRRIGKIAKLAENLLMKKSGRSKWTIQSARPIGNARDVFGNLIKPADILEEKIDPEVIAGVKITRDDEKQFDGTLKAKLDKLFT